MIHPDWVADLAQYLRDANFLNGAVFAFEMPEDICPGAMVIPPLEGLVFDPELPNRYKGFYQLLVRTNDHRQAHDLGTDVMQLLTLHNVPIGGMYIDLSEAVATPIVFPRTEAGQYEASVNMRIIMIDPRIFNPAMATPTNIFPGSIRIWYDLSRDSIFISTSAQVYPDRSLSAFRYGDLISVTIANAGSVVIPPRHFSLFGDKDGNTFAGAAEVLQYLNVQFQASDRATTGDQTVTYNQSVPSATWTVIHNLGQDPSAVSVYVGGILVFANVDPIDNNTIQINFATPQVGKVVLRK
jgi:hypothetical protein